MPLYFFSCYLVRHNNRFPLCRMLYFIRNQPRLTLLVIYLPFITYITPRLDCVLIAALFLLLFVTYCLLLFILLTKESALFRCCKR